MRKLILLIILATLVKQLEGQNITIAKQLIDTLTSTKFWGRGYTKDGNQKAAEFIRHYYRSKGLKPLDGKDFYQPLSFPVNTFPDKMMLSINGKILKPGIDFIVSPDSKGIATAGNFNQEDSVTYVDVENHLILILKDKLTWSVATKTADYTVVEIRKTSLSAAPQNYLINIDNKFIPAFHTNNIAAVCKGRLQPDSFIFITAHYDHLGGMGKDTYFPGANDNASGTSLLLGMADYFAKHPPLYSIAFISFTGEEAGLIGSKYFTEHPLVPLHKIKFLINLDLEGTGIEGATVVNASVYKKEFNLLKAINEQYNLLPAIHEREKAANSDHYWFTEQGVPSFFIYTMGGIKAYHDVYDVASTLPMDHYENLLKLLTEFIQREQQ